MASIINWRHDKISWVFYHIPSMRGVWHWFPNSFMVATISYCFDVINSCVFDTYIFLTAHTYNIVQTRLVWAWLANKQTESSIRLHRTQKQFTTRTFICNIVEIIAKKSACNLRHHFTVNICAMY